MALQSLTVGLPRTMWILVVLGAIATLASTWFFDVRGLTVHFWLTVLLAVLLGMIIHLLAAMDNPLAAITASVLNPSKWCIRT